MFPFDTLLDYFLGAIAASIRISIGMERGEKLSYPKAYTTAVSSIIISGTGGRPMAEYAHLPLTLGHFIAFLLGLFAVGLVYQIYDGKITIPLFGQLIKQNDMNSLAPKKEDL